MSKKSKNDGQNKLVLNEIIQELRSEYESIYKDKDLKSFSHAISLQEYQVAALENALTVLKIYMQENGGKYSQKKVKRGETLYEKYREEMGWENTGDKKLVSKNTINRASFWMATGSGKSIVMIKLIALLDMLMKENIIPKKPIMLLAPNDKIIFQFKQNVELYNNFQSEGIELKALKEYESSGVQESLFNTSVFTSRSDLLDNAENVGKDAKAKRLNYKNFLNENGWYILLDEAHKGDSKESIRKRYIYELSRGFAEYDIEYPRGFIFNFSATFDDAIDFITCAFNYNLEKFNREGYGKNIALLDSNLAAFKSSADKDLENESEKLERILESFIIFNAIKQSKIKLLEQSKQYKLNLLYHNPLIIAVADKVNTKEAGIKLYFEAILKILSSDIEISQIARKLESKLRELSLYYQHENLSKEFLECVKNTDSKTLRKNIFHANERAGLEACKIKGNDKELAFKSKNALKPFMLLNIGKAKEWEKEYLQTLNVESGEDIAAAYFDTINSPDSPINIMMGSKIFSEGWDSNRVNLISFINIGSKNAKKYVLQTIGRGVRIEPFKHIRKRLSKCDIGHNALEKLAGQACALETLFIMASDEGAIKSILEGIESFVTTSHILKGFKLTNVLSPLPVPRYKENLSKARIYKISLHDFNALKGYIESFDEDILLLNSKLRSKDMGYSSLKHIQNLCASGMDTKIEISGDRAFLKPKNALSVIDSFFHSSGKEVDKIDALKEGEIKHYQNMQSTLDIQHIQFINDKIKELVKLKAGKSNEALLEEYEAGKINKPEFLKSINENKKAVLKIDVSNGDYELSKELSRHYYIPMIIDKKGDNKINYAIKNASEKEFLQDLESFVKRENNALLNYEWCFSRLVENVDNVFIPYFDESVQCERKFYPDFIFWFKSKANASYKLIFIDPKGLSHEANARDKLQGFKELFEDKNLFYEGAKIEIKLFYYNKDLRVPSDFKPYVRATCDAIFSSF